MIKDIDIAELIPTTRKASRLIQEQFSEKLDISLSINGWENTKIKTSTTAKQKILQFTKNFTKKGRLNNELCNTPIRG